MALTHTWRVDTLFQKGDGSDIIKSVKFDITSTESNTGTSITAAHIIHLDEPAPESVIPYESLTEATVIGWIETKLGATMVSNLESSNADWISSKDTPVAANTIIVEGLPW